MKRSLVISTTSVLLIILWAYTVSSKLSEFRHFKIQMRRQVFPEGMSEALVYILPITEIIAAALLCFAVTRIYGFVFSSLLLLAFSIYIALILTNVFGKVPCSCGGVLEQLGWGEHLIFNLAFLSLSIAGLFAEINNLKERRR